MNFSNDSPDSSDYLKGARYFNQMHGHIPRFMHHWPGLAGPAWESLAKVHPGWSALNNRRFGCSTSSFPPLFPPLTSVFLSSSSWLRVHATSEPSKSPSSHSNHSNSARTRSWSTLYELQTNSPRWVERSSKKVSVSQKNFSWSFSWCFESKRVSTFTVCSNCECSSPV